MQGVSKIGFEDSFRTRNDKKHSKHGQGNEVRYYCLARFDTIFTIDTRNNLVFDVFIFYDIYRFDFETAITRNESLFKGEISLEIATRISSLRMFRYFLGTPCAHV